DIMQRYRADLGPAEKALADARLAQRQAIETVPLDEGKVQTAADGVARADVAAALIEARLFNAVYAILTPDQQAQAKDILARREPMMGQREQRLQQRQQKGKA